MLFLKHNNKDIFNMKHPRQLFALLSLMFAGCQINRLDVDISDTAIPAIEIMRLEKDMFGVDTSNIYRESENLAKKYGMFYLYFVRDLVRSGGQKDSSLAYNHKLFVSNNDMREVYDECIKQYPDLNKLQEGLQNAFRHYSYYFPDKKLPKVVSFMSGFNYSVVKPDSVLGIALEMYLGSSHRIYDLIPSELLPNYRRRNMNPQNMLPDCIKGWMLSDYGQEPTKNDFLSRIVHAGKILYLTDAMLPDIHDTLKMGYSAAQLEWCQKNEKNMWAYFVDKKMLYSTDYAEASKFLNEGPFTAAFNKESPARVGQWIGWQIVRRYMNKNDHVTLPDLLKEQDSQKILTLSKYKPK